MKGSEIMIEVKGLKKYYGKNRGIENVSFMINDGETYGLIGPNGAGKSTTIRILTGLLNEDSGEAYIGGFRIPKQINKVKAAIGYIPGEVNFYGDMRVKDFLELNRNFYKNVDIDYERYIVDLLGIDTNKRFKELSLGNKKKVAILQAFVHKPHYLVLDEPTNGLDPLIQQKFYSLLEDHRRTGAVVLFSSHVLSEVEKVCQRFGMIKEGKMIKEGDVNTLKELTYKVVEIRGFSGTINGYEGKINRNGITFHVKIEELKDFLKRVTEHEFEDIEIKNPTLENIFLKYYKEEVK